jgi:hypothetical protein
MLRPFRADDELVVSRLRGNSPSLPFRCHSQASSYWARVETDHRQQRILLRPADYHPCDDMKTRIDHLCCGSGQVDDSYIGDNEIITVEDDPFEIGDTER